MKNVILGFMVILFIGCGSSSSTKELVVSTTQSDAPKSPITKEKGQTPPSIPAI